MALDPSIMSQAPSTLPLKFATAKEDCSGPDLSSVETKTYPLDTTFARIMEDRGISAADGVPVAHLWLKFLVLKNIYVLPKTRKGVEVTWAELSIVDDDKYVELPNDCLNMKLCSFPCVAEWPIIVETRNAAGIWTMAKRGDSWKKFEVGDIIDAMDGQGKWYEAYVRKVGSASTAGLGEGKLILHFVGWNVKWDEINEHQDKRAMRGTYTIGPFVPGSKSSSSAKSPTSVSHKVEVIAEAQQEVEVEVKPLQVASTPTQKGIVSLCCRPGTESKPSFLFNAVQCLAQTPLLTQYFIDGSFKSKGKLAEAWSKLMADMHSNKLTSISVCELTDILPRLMADSSERDSQPLLGYLLDALHGDLNTAKTKPAAAIVGSETEVAKEAWSAHLQGNQSVIADLMHGQIKELIECPDCGSASTEFKPYTCLSVPVYNAKCAGVSITYVPCITNGTAAVQLPRTYVIQLAEGAEIGALKQAVAKRVGVPQDELVVCDVSKLAIRYTFEARDKVKDLIERSDNIFVYYVPQPETEEKEELVCNTFTVNVTVSGGLSIREPRLGIPLLISLPMTRETSFLAMRRQLRNLIKPYLGSHIFKNNAKDPIYNMYLHYGYSFVSEIFPNEIDTIPVEERNLAFSICFEKKRNYNDTLIVGKKEFGEKVALVDCLAALAQPVLAECSKCAAHKQANRVTELWSAPPILIIHLQRFADATESCERSNILVDFPFAELNIGNFVRDEESMRDAVYDLYAISNDVGGLSCGACARNLHCKTWYHFDESGVTPVAVPESMKSPAASVLYYKRVRIADKLVDRLADKLADKLVDKMADSSCTKMSDDCLFELEEDLRFETGAARTSSADV